MKKWKVRYSQNYWEYSGFVIIKANEVKKISECVLIADGIEIEFEDELVDEPILITDN